MKFEKFLKGVGTHGEVIERNEGEKWLVCGGVGMIIPKGVNNLLGKKWPGEYASIVDVIANAELDDKLKLVDAVLLDPTGNAGSIYRVFESELGERVGIINADYGLLEKSDLLGYGEVEVPKKDTEESDETMTIKYVLVYDRAGNIQGFITGSDKF
jgi:hypothetical protein